MIYDSFFGFTEEPFGVTPNPDFLYLSRAHEEALAHIRFGIAEERGFIMLTGEIGSGKTTLMRYFIEGLDETVHTSVIMNPKGEPAELLKLIARDFGMECSGATYESLMARLDDFLIQSFKRGEKSVIMIDEAQDMNPESLEFIRLLSNLETNTRKLLQVVLIGQPELRAMVAGERLRQLDQRISVRYHIGPLGKDEVNSYISHRLIRAGSTRTFPKKTTGMIYRYSRGVPRLINRACDRVLLYAYAEGKRDIEAGVVRGALKELGMTERPALKYAVASVLLVMITLLAAEAVRKKRLSGKHSYGTEVQRSETGPPDAKFFLDSEGMVMAAGPDQARDAVIASLLKLWGEAGMPLGRNSKEIASERGYSISTFRADWKRLERLNMPAAVRMREKGKERWALLLWIIEGDAVLFDPLKGREIVPAERVKKSASQFVMLWKNKYNSADKISLLQRELSDREFLQHYRDGVLEQETRQAIRKFQKSSGIPATGRMDEETMIMLSKSRVSPEIYPQEIKRGGWYGHQGTKQRSQG